MVKIIIIINIYIYIANFPSSSCAKNKLVRAHGVNAITMVEAILKFLPSFKNKTK